ncbi:hypothetical protein GCM10028812_06470 [Ancylobacter sonchi]
MTPPECVERRVLLQRHARRQPRTAWLPFRLLIRYGVKVGNVERCNPKSESLATAPCSGRVRAKRNANSRAKPANWTIQLGQPHAKHSLNVVEEVKASVARNADRSFPQTSKKCSNDHFGLQEPSID